jgi:hypothetical protein
MRPAVYSKRARLMRSRLFLPCPQSGGPELESLALELGFTLSTAGEIEGRFREVIQLLERAAPTDE